MPVSNENPNAMRRIDIVSPYDDVLLHASYWAAAALHRAPAAVLDPATRVAATAQKVVLVALGLVSFLQD
jgi:hypothetical protein